MIHIHKFHRGVYEIFPHLRHLVGGRFSGRRQCRVWGCAPCLDDISITKKIGEALQKREGEVGKQHWLSTPVF